MSTVLLPTDNMSAIKPGPVRSSGDGMEMSKLSVTPELITDSATDVTVARHSPKCTPPGPSGPGVLHLGRISLQACTEVEATRILVPHTAISRCMRAVTVSGQQGEQHLPAEPYKPTQELKSALDKLQISERRLLQDKEGLSNQLRVQTEVNRELKKLLVASVGDDLQYHFERLAREKNQLVLENETLLRNLAQTSEQLERMSIQCDVWRSKFLASRVMAEELTNARAAMQRQTREAQTALQDLLREREEFSQDMLDTHRCLEQLLVSLQWGRQQTYYPSAQPLSTSDLASANYKLAQAVNSHLLGNVGNSSSLKTSLVSELCSTPAEKMAEKVLRFLDPVLCSEGKCDPPVSDSSHNAFLPCKKNIGRFHPYTRYENITFNCCERCTGEIIVL